MEVKSFVLDFQTIQCNYFHTFLDEKVLNYSYFTLKDIH